MSDVTGSFGVLGGVNKLVSHRRRDYERNSSQYSDDIKWSRDNRVATTAGYRNFNYTQSFVLNSGVIAHTDFVAMPLTRYNVDGLLVDTADTRRVKERGGWYAEDSEF